MTQRFAVIGLGAFGAAIACELASRGKTVIAIDKDLERVERLRDDVSSATCLDATEPEVLAAHHVHTVDVALISTRHNFEEDRYCRTNRHLSG
jgi:trk system potassium uptake protein TrkA